MRKAFRIKLLCLTAQASQNPHPQPDTKMAPEWTKAVEAPFPGHPSHRAEEKGQLEEAGNIKPHRDTGIPE